MPDFRVGDRVKRVDGSGGYSDKMFVGSFGIVTNPYNRNGCVEVLTNGHEVTLLPHRFELAPLVPVEAPQHRSVFYTLVYKTRMTDVRTMGFPTQREFDEKKEQVLRNGGIVFGEKKITLNVDVRY